MANNTSSLSNANTVNGSTLEIFSPLSIGISSAKDKGSKNVKQVPFSSRLFNFIFPPSNSASPFTIASPNPTPSTVTAFGNLSKAVKMRICSSSLIPVPVSSTSKDKTPPEKPVRRVILPCEVNLTALDNKLAPIWRIRFLSPTTTASQPFSTSNLNPFSIAKGINSACNASVML